MAAYTVVQNQMHAVDIRSRIFRVVVVPIGNRYRDDHRVAVFGDRNINQVFKAHSKRQTVEGEGIGYRIAVGIGVMNLHRSLALAHRFMRPERRHRRRNNLQVGIDEVHTTRLIERRVHIMTGSHVVVSGLGYKQRIAGADGVRSHFEGGIHHDNFQFIDGVATVDGLERIIEDMFA